MNLSQPDFLPDIFESGTPNVPGIAGLCEGIKYVIDKKPCAISAHERELVKSLVLQAFLFG